MKLNRETRPCQTCGQLVTRCKSRMRKNVFCSMACSKPFLSKNFTALNAELNPDRMTPEVREKLRLARLDSGLGITYTKTYGRHTHRIVAEQKLGRPLMKGEVVHHKDENKRNNHPDNIEVLPSQAEHARHHFLKNNPRKRNGL